MKSPPETPPPPARYKPRHQALSASLAGIVEILVTFPLEFVKTQLQLQQTNPQAKAARREFSSSWQCVRVTVQRAGWRGLYQGVQPWLAFAVPRNVVRFGTFERAVDLLPALHVPSHLVAATAGLVAGTVEAALVVTPMQAIQVKLIHDTNSPRPSFGGSFWRACWTIPQREGVVLGLFPGLAATVIKGGLTNCIRFGSFGLLSSWVQRVTGRVQLDASHSMVCGGLAGLLSVVVSHPVDVVKSNMQSLGAAARYRSSLHCARVIWAADGLRGLFHGFGPRCSRVCCEIALLFTLYDQFGRILDERW